MGSEWGSYRPIGPKTGFLLLILSLLLIAWAYGQGR